MKWTPTRLKWMMNMLFAPYRGAGVKVRRVGPDWRSIELVMHLRRFNRNIHGTHFGGSLYSMVDPHYVLLVSQLLGPAYAVWDKAARIDFVKPGEGTMHARFDVTDEDLARIRNDAANGDACYPEFTVDIVDSHGGVVAHVTKKLYVRKKPAK